MTTIEISKWGEGRTRARHSEVIGCLWGPLKPYRNHSANYEQAAQLQAGRGGGGRGCMGAWEALVYEGEKNEIRSINEGNEELCGRKATSEPGTPNITVTRL